MTTPTPTPRGVIVVLGAATDSTGELVAQTVVFPRGDAWEYNDQRVSIKNLQNEVIGEFRNGCYIGIGYRPELRVNKLRETTTPTS